MVKLTEAQQAARLAILRDVDRSGGVDTWSHLHSHGHDFNRVVACAYRGDLKRTDHYRFELTDLGRSVLSDSKLLGGEDAT